MKLLSAFCHRVKFPSNEIKERNILKFRYRGFKHANTLSYSVYNNVIGVRNSCVSLRLKL